MRIGPRQARENNKTVIQDIPPSLATTVNARRHSQLLYIDTLCFRFLTGKQTKSIALSLQGYLLNLIGNVFLFSAILFKISLRWLDIKNSIGVNAKLHDLYFTFSVKKKRRKKANNIVRKCKSWLKYLHETTLWSWVWNKHKIKEHQYQSKNITLRFN